MILEERALKARLAQGVEFFIKSYVLICIFRVLKPFQNKKGQKRIPGAQFSVSFFTAAS